MSVEDLRLIAARKNGYDAVPEDEDKLRQLNGCDEWFDDLQTIADAFVRAEVIIRVHDDMNKRIQPADVNTHLACGRNLNHNHFVNHLREN